MLLVARGRWRMPRSLLSTTAPASSLSKYTIIIGVLLSLLFFAVTRAEIRARTRAERATEEVKQSETTIRKTLTAARACRRRTAKDLRRFA